MNDSKQFEDIKLALLGTKVLETPRVSRETIISVLQTHTDLIMNMKKDNTLILSKMASIEAENGSNRKIILELQSETQQIKKDVENLYRLSNEFRAEMDELSQKVAELYVVKKQLAEQKEFTTDLNDRYSEFNLKVNSYMTNNSVQLERIQGMCDKTVFELKVMKDYVDHFADNLVLNSQQIMVDSSTGLCVKPTSLTDVLKTCNTQFSELDTVQQKAEQKIEKLTKEMDDKVSNAIMFNINTLEKKVGTIELHIQKEEEQGIGAIRKTCEELSIQMQATQAELSDKIDRESVGFIVHEKYNEIVKFLEDALQSSLEDEKNFKEKAEEIQEMVILLSNSKADRTEIANMQEMMVKSESLLKKVGTQANLKDKLRDMVTRKEVDALLSNKVDRLELEHLLQSTMANTRKNRKLNAFSTSLQPIEDSLSANQYSSGAQSLLSQSLPNPSNHALNNQYLNEFYGENSNQPNPLNEIVSSYQQQQGVMTISPPGSANKRNTLNKLDNIEVNGGTFQSLQTSIGQGNENHSGHQRGGGGIQNDSYSGSNQKNQGGNDGNVQTVVPVIALGQGIPNGTQSKQKGDFASFIKDNKNKVGKLSTSSSSPILNSKINLKNKVNLPEGYGNSEYPYTDIPYNINMESGSLNLPTASIGSLPTSSNNADHLSYLQGPIIGGGFNGKSTYLQKGMVAGNSVPDDDIEGKGL